MKAVCLLLCLALCRLTAGNIFRRQQQPDLTKNLIVDSLDYIDQQQQYQNQNYQNQNYQNQHKSSEQSSNSATNSASNSKESRENVRRLQNQYTSGQSDESASKEYQRHNKQSRNRHNDVNYSYESTSRHNNKDKRQQTYQQQSKDVYRRKADSSANSNSYESKENINSNTDFVQRPLYGEELKRNSGVPLFILKNQPAYGDAIIWKGVKIADGPNSAVQNKKDIEEIFKDAYNNMKHLNEDEKKQFHEQYQQAAKTISTEEELNATQLLNQNNYEVEEYTIRTDDGYYLTLFRIPPKMKTQADVQRSPVVFLMHGLMGSADDWLMMGPRKSLAYLLADQGYDVWLGNARGNKYSRRHASKHPAQTDFWQFSNDEIALHDLPAMIDYALKTSDQKKLYYIGHTEGTTAFFALVSARPEYNNKVAMMYALSPMVYMSNTRSPLLRMIAPNSPFYELLREQLGKGEFKPKSELIHTVGGSMCENEIGCKYVCSNVDIIVSGVNVEHMDTKLIAKIMKHLPAGASTRQMKQYGQAVSSNEFRKYDYGADINEKVYGQREAPKYDMTKVRTPVALYYSEHDWLAHPSDVQRLEKELEVVKDVYKVPVDLFSTLDFQYSEKAPEVVYDRLIKSIEQQKTQQKYSY